MSFATQGAIELNSYSFDADVVEQLASNYFAQNNWPLVYFLDDDTKRIAYVGESTDASSRMRSHLANSERKKLNRLTVIGSNRFNKSATLDIESKLIQFISADGRYKLQNGNGGLRGHNYYQQSEYERLFELIWEELLENGLAKHSLEEIKNSNLFKYSPYKTLTAEQRNAVFNILEQIVEGGNKTIFTEGSAGTGKTIIATYLMMLLSSPLPALEENEDAKTFTPREYDLLKSFFTRFQNASIALVVPMTSLRETLKRVFRDIPNLKASMVIGPSDLKKKKYDLVLVDEAHRLAQRRNIPNYGSFDSTNTALGFGKEGTQLDWVLKQSNHHVLLYDSAQSVKPSDIPKDRFDALKWPSNTIRLKTQMRVSAGVDYLTFVDDLLNCRPTAANSIPNDYDLRFYESFTDLNEDLQKQEVRHGLCRRVAGYAWPWKSKKDKTAKDIELEGQQFQWNMEASDWINSKNAPQEIGCIHTTQGYDLNYAGVIFGHEITYNKQLDRIEILAENYFDANGKKGVKDPEKLKEYIVNIYKTVMHRGIRGCYVYVCDPALRAYFKNRFEALGPQHAVAQRPQKLPFKILTEEERIQNPKAIPLIPHYAAAGGFSERKVIDDFEWVELWDDTPVDKRYFVMQVVGESMNKVIPNGAYCLFRKYTGGAREGKIVLAQHSDLNFDGEPVGFTVKRYRARKMESQGRLFNLSVTLVAESSKDGFENLEIAEERGQVRVLGELVNVL